MKKQWTCLKAQITAAMAVELLVAQAGAPAADFSHAQKIYVPPSRILRTNRDSLAGQSEYGSYINRGSGSSRVSAPAIPSGTLQALPAPGNTAPVSGGSQGLVPPPPPLPIDSRQLVLPPPAAGLPFKEMPAVYGKTGVLKRLPGENSTEARAKAARQIKQGHLEDADLILRAAHSASPGDALVTSDLYDLSIKRAGKFLAGNKLELAARAARQAVYINPGSASAGSLLDRSLKKQGINPYSAGERLQLGDKLAAQGRSLEALVEYRASLKLMPGAQAHVGLGNMDLRAGQKEKAREEYELALEMDSHAKAAHRQLGLLKLSDGDLIGANFDLSRAVILDEKDASAGKALIELWQKQVAKYPNNVNSHLGLARAYQLSGDLKSAHAEYQQVVRLDPQHPNLPACRQSFQLALSRQEAGRCLEAARTLESQGALAEAHGKVTEALNLCPVDVNCRMYQGHLFERLCQYQQAHDTYLTVLRHDPENIAAAQRLAVLSPLLGVPGAVTPAAVTQVQGTLHALAAPAIVSTPAPGLRPMLMPDNHVACLSNFLGQLRDHIVLQQNQDKFMERSTHQALDQFLQSPAAASAQDQGIMEELKLASGWQPTTTDIDIIAPPSPDPPAKNTSPLLPHVLASTKASDAGVESQRSPVKLELEGVSNTSQGMRLKVVLKNNQDVALPVASQIAGIIHDGLHQDMTVKVSFHNKNVPAHGRIHGTIKIPAKTISPAADLFLPNLLPPSCAQRDVHLSYVAKQVN